MPNLLQIRSLRNKYQPQGSPVSGFREIKLLTENFQRNYSEIVNQFRLEGGDIRFLRYFENQESADLVMLFIDITNFSTKMQAKKNHDISTYLDAYYDKVIPKIYSYGGEIEKIIGDGIICIFGAPFLESRKQDLFVKADACAKDIIATLKNTDKEVKIALHDGEIMYYKNKSLTYPEYTVIGHPLTELFRLESISNNNSVNYYYRSNYDYQSCSSESSCWIKSLGKYFHWVNLGPFKVDLKGVAFSHIKTTECKY